MVDDVVLSTMWCLAYDNSELLSDVPSRLISTSAGVGEQQELLWLQLICSSAAHAWATVLIVEPSWLRGRWWSSVYKWTLPIVAAPRNESSQNLPFLPQWLSKHSPSMHLRVMAVWQLQPKVALIRVQCRATCHPDTKCNPNPNATAKQHAIVNIQLNIVTSRTYPDTYVQDMLLHRLH